MVRDVIKEPRVFSETRGAQPHCHLSPPDVDLTYEEMLSRIGRAIAVIPAIPAHVLGYAILDADLGNISEAAANLCAWAATAKLRVSEPTAAPGVWVLHYDGYRRIGMEEAEPSLSATDILESAEGACAHCGHTIIVDFSRSCRVPGKSWELFSSFPRMYPYNFHRIVAEIEDED